MQREMESEEGLQCRRGGEGERGGEGGRCVDEDEWRSWSGGWDGIVVRCLWFVVLVPKGWGMIGVGNASFHAQTVSLMRWG